MVADVDAQPAPETVLNLPSNEAPVSAQNGEHQLQIGIFPKDQHVLEDIARLNQLDPAIPWARVRDIMKTYITANIEQLKNNEASLFDKQAKPPWPLSDGDLAGYTKQIWTLLDQFPETAPFTVQRLAELSLSYHPYYSKSLPAYLRAILRCVCVSSTVEEIPDSPLPSSSPSPSVKSLPPSPSLSSSSPLLTSTSTSIIPANLPSAFHSDDEDEFELDQDGKKKKTLGTVPAGGRLPLRRTRSETSADTHSNVRRRLSRQHHQNQQSNRSSTVPSPSSSTRRHSSVLSLSPHTPQLTPTPFFFNRLRDASSHDDQYNISTSASTGGLVAVANTHNDSMPIDVTDNGSDNNTNNNYNNTNQTVVDSNNLHPVTTQSLENMNLSSTQTAGGIFEGMFGSLKDRFIPESSSS